MKKKFILKLLLLVVFSISMYSCIRDDISSSDLSPSKEYNSKSVWKEDETYIKNVMKIYQENESEIKKGNGTPLWDYAMTMGRTNESFLIVPVANGKTIVSCIQVPRNGEQIKFVYDIQQDHIKFFQGYTTSEKRKPLEQTTEQSSTAGRLTMCAVSSISMWYPDDNYAAGGYWETQYITKCTENPGDGGPSNPGDPTYPYYPGGGGGTGSQNPNRDIINELKDYPCAQDLVKQLPNLKNDIAVAMKGIFNNNENYNILFKAKSGLGNVDGTTFTTSSSEFGTFKATINLNDNVLKNATKEYILVTMYHEVIHAYLDYERFKLGANAFQDQFPSVIVGYDYAADGTKVNRYTFIAGHQELGAFLTTLQNILSSYNSSLPTETVKAMAKAGITTMTAEESQLNKNERDTSLGNQKGTKCP